jgi:hypothetical protein
MFGRFIVVGIALVVVLTTASMGEEPHCDGDYRDGKCVPRRLENNRASDRGRDDVQSLTVRPNPQSGPAPQSPSTTGQAKPGPTSTPASGDVDRIGRDATDIQGDRRAESRDRDQLLKDAIQDTASPGDVGAIRDKAVRTQSGSVAAAPSPRRILETGYARLDSVGAEKPGYGLYSYILITSYSNKSVKLLDEIFKVIPNIKNTAASPNQINILYIPFVKEKENEFSIAAQSAGTLGEKYAASFYNFQMARAILDHLCNPPADVLRQLCGSDLSRGPFIFTYEKPASTFEPIQAPYLFVDLRDVHENAFAEFVSAYQEQVKSDDVNAGERLNTLRLKFLNLALNAADFFKPVPEALADVVHSAVLKPQ